MRVGDIELYRKRKSQESICYNCLTVDERPKERDMNSNFDDLEIPEFLRRTQTPDQAARLKRITARYGRPKIKNPRYAKRGERQILAPLFGHSIKVT